MFRTKVTISLLEVILGLLQPLHPVLDLQLELRLMKRIPNDLPCQKNIGFDTTSKSLACSEPKLQFHSLKSYLASYSTSIQFLTSRSILGSWRRSPMICSHFHIVGPLSEILVALMPRKLALLPSFTPYPPY